MESEELSETAKSEVSSIYKVMISAKVVADSQNSFGNRIVTMEVVFPRIILAEFNTHRMFSRNSASSRAIPYRKLLKSVIEDPFIPIAIQLDHSGMQGKEYLDMDREYYFEEVRGSLAQLLEKNFKNEDGTWDEDYIGIDKIINDYLLPLLACANKITIKDWWLKIRDLVVASSLILASFGVTKQICNRLLEVFIKNHKVLVTSTEWENFFALRCPQYTNFQGDAFRSKKDYACTMTVRGSDPDEMISKFGLINWLELNKGQAEIHMMALAEAMWDSYNESTPKLLKEGEWHIPYEKEISADEINKIITLSLLDGGFGPKWESEDYDSKTKYKVEISTVMAARTSYTVVGEDQKPLTYKRMIEIHDELKAAWPKHMSPFEHCAQSMTKNEYMTYTRTRPGLIDKFKEETGEEVEIESKQDPYVMERGWLGNFRGFKQYRKMIVGENITV